MPTITLPDFKEYVRDSMVYGVIEDIYTTNAWWEFIPWLGFAGSGILANRENTVGDAQFLAIGGTITAKAASITDPILFAATTCIGDAEINEQEIAMSGSDPNDIVAREIQSKAKSVGRKLQEGTATGNGTAPNMNSLHSMVDSSQYVTGTGALTFGQLDALIDKVKSKDGFVDFILMNSREILKLRNLYRALGGVPMLEVQMGNRTIKIMEFNGTPVFQNDWLSTTETANGAALTGGALSSVYAGNFDDGTKKIGLSMIYPEAVPAGISVKEIGAMETRDEIIWRIKAYTNLAVFNRRGLARLTDIDGT